MRQPRSLTTAGSYLVALLGAVLAVSCNVASDTSTSNTTNASGWAGALQLDTLNTAANASGTTIAMDAAGNLFPAWEQASALGLITLWGDPYSVTSSGFLGEASLTPGLSGAGRNTQVAVGGNSVFMYAWEQSQSNSDSEIYVNRWSAAKGMDAPMRVNAGYGTTPALALNANGDACVVWTELGTNAMTVLASFRASGGTAWSLPTQVSSGTANALLPRVGIDDADNVIVLWSESAGTQDGPYTVHLASYTVAKGWTAPVSPQAGALADPNYVLAMTDAGAQVAWADSADSGKTWQVYTARWTAAGAWGARVLLSGTGIIAHNPALGLDASGNAVAVWMVGTTSLYHASYTSGTGWTATPVLFTSTTSGLGSPAIAMNAGGTGAMAWQQSDGSVWRIAAATYATASGWATPAYIQASTGGDALVPAVATGSNGESVVLWTQKGADALEHVYANLYQ